jgi:hypothetical protein
MLRVEHFIITRFNVRSSGVLSRGRAQPNWLDHRIGLFERFCLPSVQSQIRSDFRWLIYFDSETPQSYREIFNSYENIPQVVAIHVGLDQFNAARIREDILGLLTGSTTHILTTRLDNDDALSRHFVERLRGEIETSEKLAYNFSNGLIFHRDKIYLTKDPGNAFVSLLEPREDLRTVWARSHAQLQQIAPVFQMKGAPAWLQVVHELNVANRVVGKRVLKRDWLQDFSVDLDTQPRETAHEVALDNLSSYPGRWLRHRRILARRKLGALRRFIHKRFVR